MKKFLIIISVLTIALHSKAENDTINKLNEVSIVVSDFVDAGIHFKYERKLRNQYSIGLGFGYKGENGLINISGIDNDRIRTNDIGYSGVKITPELRYYFRKTQQFGLDGFYVGFYSKNTFFKSGVNGVYTSKNDNKYLIDIDTKIKVYSLGLSVGYKLAVTERLSIDFLMAGPGVGFYNFKLSPKITLPDQFYSDLNSVLSKFSYFDTTNPDFSFEISRKKTEFTSVSFRYALSIGFTF